ncbi:MAG: membrane dipeptidase [Pseudomonadota bacterium]
MSGDLTRRGMLGATAGLAATSALAADDVAVKAKALAIHRRVLVLDSHADVPDDFGTGAHEAAVDGDTQVDLPKLKRGGVGAVVLAAFAPQGPRTTEGVARARALSEAKLAAILGVPQAHPDQATLALSPAAAEAARRSGKVAIVPGFLNAHALGDDVTAIDRLHAQGVRLFGFVHAGNNAFADSSRPSGGQGAEHGGLSLLGREAVGRLNRLGVLVDVSQLTRAGALQAIELSRAPVVATHSGVTGVVDSPRNLSDGELDAIARKGGVVQIVAFKSYILRPPADYAAKVRAVRTQYGLPAEYVRPTDGSGDLPAERRTDYSHALSALLPDATVADLVSSIDYAVKRVGVDHVGIGSDFNHGGGVAGWRNAGEALSVTTELVRRGYDEASIAKLWGGNFLRAWRGAEAAAG